MKVLQLILLTIIKLRGHGGASPVSGDNVVTQTYKPSVNETCQIRTLEIRKSENHFLAD